MKVQEDALTETKKTFRSNTCIQSMGNGYAKAIHENGAEVLAPRLENKISREMHL